MSRLHSPARTQPRRWPVDRDASLRSLAALILQGAWPGPSCQSIGVYFESWSATGLSWQQLQLGLHLEKSVCWPAAVPGFVASSFRLRGCGEYRTCAVLHGQQAPARRQRPVLQTVSICAGQCQCSPARPNLSFKRSANGMSRWPSSAGPSAHFALAVQRAMPLSPA